MICWAVDIFSLGPKIIFFSLRQILILVPTYRIRSYFSPASSAIFTYSSHIFTHTHTPCLDILLCIHISGLNISNFVCRSWLLKWVWLGWQCLCLGFTLLIIDGSAVSTSFTLLIIDGSAVSTSFTLMIIDGSAISTSFTLMIIDGSAVSTGFAFVIIDGSAVSP